MKVQVILNTPDCLYYTAENIVVWNKDGDEDVEQTEIEREKFARVAKKWVKYDELLVVEIDTEEESIRVLEV
jgi:hypothetical protein